MKILLVTAGAILALAGTIFMLQGIGLLPGSFMSNQSRWIYIGLGTDVVAIGLWVLAARQGKRRLP